MSFFVCYNQTDSISWVYNWQDKNYDVVEILQVEKGQHLKSPYVIRFTIMPQKEGIGKLGTDRITFGVDPTNPDGNLRIKFLQYEHKVLNK